MLEILQGRPCRRRTRRASRPLQPSARSRLSGPSRSPAMPLLPRIEAADASTRAPASFAAVTFPLGPLSRDRHDPQPALSSTRQTRQPSLAGRRFRIRRRKTDPCDRVLVPAFEPFDGGVANPRSGSLRGAGRSTACRRRARYTPPPTAVLPSRTLMRPGALREAVRQRPYVVTLLRAGGWKRLNLHRALRPHLALGASTDNDGVSAASSDRRSGPRRYRFDAARRRESARAAAAGVPAASPARRRRFLCKSLLLRSCACSTGAAGALGGFVAVPRCRRIARRQRRVWRSTCSVQASRDVIETCPQLTVTCRGSHCRMRAAAYGMVLRARPKLITRYDFFAQQLIVRPARLKSRRSPSNCEPLIECT